MDRVSGCILLRIKQGFLDIYFVLGFKGLRDRVSGYLKKYCYLLDSFFKNILYKGDNHCTRFPYFYYYLLDRAFACFFKGDKHGTGFPDIYCYLLDRVFTFFLQG